MANNQDKRTHADPMRIAWLLRADLRKGDPAGGPISDWFKMWWLIQGSHEYPAWTDRATLSGAGLFTPQAGRSADGGFGMTPILRFLLDMRADLASKFDVRTDEGLWDAIAWLFVHGVREHCLTAALDEQTIAALDATPSFLANDADGSPELTWLMFFVWKLSSDLRAAFDLQRPQDRRDYLSWFIFDGVPKLELGPLIAPRWTEWLRQPVLKNPAGDTVPRAAHLLWQRHQQLQRAFNLETDRGVAGLAMWSTEVWHTQQELSWICPTEAATPPPPMSMTQASQRPFGLNLIGFAFGELGIGEDVRMAAAACEAVGIPFAVVNIHPGDNLRQADQALVKHVAHAAEQTDIAPYACNLFCLTAFDTARVYLERGELFYGRYNIGWWPWELPVWPADWTPVFDLVDEVWAATSFTYRMYTEAIVRKPAPQPPVTLMPMAASVERVSPMSREELGLRKDQFLFLYVFDFNSYLARKNPFAAVKAFSKAFEESDDSVGLILKVMNANPQNPEWIRFLEECSHDRRITVLQRTMERGEVLGLIQSCDAYLSLHRAEGFGRTLAEAMLFGHSVISTDFSGNADFVREGIGYPVKWSKTPTKPGDYPFVKDADAAWWAEPDIESAILQMKKCRERAMTDYTRLLDKNTVLEIAHMRFAPITVGSAILTRLKKFESQGLC